MSDGRSTTWASTLSELNRMSHGKHQPCKSLFHVKFLSFDCPIKYLKCKDLSNPSTVALMRPGKLDLRAWLGYSLINQGTSWPTNRSCWSMSPHQSWPKLWRSEERYCMLLLSKSHTSVFEQILKCLHKQSPRENGRRNSSEFSPISTLSRSPPLLLSPCVVSLSFRVLRMDLLTFSQKPSYHLM